MENTTEPLYVKTNIIWCLVVINIMGFRLRGTELGLLGMRTIAK